MKKYKFTTLHDGYWYECIYATTPITILSISFNEMPLDLAALKTNPKFADFLESLYFAAKSNFDNKEDEAEGEYGFEAWAKEYNIGKLFSDHSPIEDGKILGLDEDILGQMKINLIKKLHANKGN